MATWPTWGILLPVELDGFPNPKQVGGLEHESYFSIQLGVSSSQLTNSYFSEGLKPPTSKKIKSFMDLYGHPKILVP